MLGWKISFTCDFASLSLVWLFHSFLNQLLGPRGWKMLMGFILYCCCWFPLYWLRMEREGVDLQKKIRAFWSEEFWILGKLPKTEIYLRHHRVYRPTEAYHKNCNFFSEKNLQSCHQTLSRESIPIKKVKYRYRAGEKRAF